MRSVTLTLLAVLLCAACSRSPSVPEPNDWIADPGAPTDVPLLEEFVDARGPDTYVGPDVQYLGAAGR